MSKISTFMPGNGFKIVYKDKNNTETSEQCILYLLDNWLIKNRNTNLKCLINGCKCHTYSEWNYSLKKAKFYTSPFAEPNIRKLILDLEDINCHRILDKLLEIL